LEQANASHSRPRPETKQPFVIPSWAMMEGHTMSCVTRLGIVTQAHPSLVGCARRSGCFFTTSESCWMPGGDGRAARSCKIVRLQPGTATAHCGTVRDDTCRGPARIAVSPLICGVRHFSSVWTDRRPDWLESTRPSHKTDDTQRSLGRTIEWRRLEPRRVGPARSLGQPSSGRSGEIKGHPRAARDGATRQTWN